ncbi:MAG: hypothetical protein Q7K55_01000 [Candidatus Levybacteria bacterium]|nr:hypothetical protein [Candidatus Levybacteria bacterium]
MSNFKETHLMQVNPSELTPSQQRTRQLIERNLGPILKIAEIQGGLVSRVYRVYGEKQKGIVKIRGKTFAKIPSIQMDPNEVRYEYAAIQFLSQVEPSIFPHPLAYDAEESMILMTDIMPDEQTLEKRLENKEVSLGDMITLGKTIGRLHMKLAKFQDSMREGHDDEDYEEGLFYRLGGNRNNPTLNAIAETLKQLPKQIIIADLSPKNIGRGKDGQVTICDLESCYRGNTIFSLGYLAGHVLLHNLGDYPKATSLINGLLEGYNSENLDVEVDSLLLKRICLATTLYRLDNPIIPYALSLSQEEKTRKTATSIKLLEEQSMSWDRLVKKMVSA